MYSLCGNRRKEAGAAELATAPPTQPRVGETKNCGRGESHGRKSTPNRRPKPHGFCHQTTEIAAAPVGVFGKVASPRDGKVLYAIIRQLMTPSKDGISAPRNALFAAQVRKMMCSPSAPTCVLWSHRDQHDERLTHYARNVDVQPSPSDVSWAKNRRWNFSAASDSSRPRFITDTAAIDPHRIYLRLGQQTQNLRWRN